MRLIDPTPQQLAAQLDAAAEVRGRDWDEVLAALGTRSEGLGRVDAVEPFAVCWWTDRIGRRHWALPLDVELTNGRGSVRHPLEGIAPPLSSGWRERGGRREFVVVCRCGVVGSPESVGWMGSTCGPCFDREQDGPPLPPLPPGEIRQILLTPSERLFVVHTGGGVYPMRTTLLAYANPLAATPAWERSWEGYQRVAACDALVAVGSETGNVELVDPADGSTRQRFHTGPEVMVPTGFVGIGSGTLVGQGHDRVQFWDVRGAVASRVGVAKAPSLVMGSLAAHPDGTRVAACTYHGIDVFDVASRRLVDRLVTGGEGLWGGVYLDDGSLCATDESNGPEGARLCRWGGGPRVTGALGRLFGPWSRRPDVVAPWCGPHHILATDGRRLLVSTPNALGLYDGPTLRLVTALEGRSLWPIVAAFAPGGRLLVGGEQGLAIWPWRECSG